jgi:serine/threonine protein kinase
MQVEISVTAGPAEGQHFAFDKPDCFFFGRAGDAHVSLPDDKYVSRQHFLLEISPPECKLKDLDSKNGVIVNGIRYGGRKSPKEGIEQAQSNEVYLKDGDEISVGVTRIKVFIRSDIQTDEKPYESGAQGRIIYCSHCGKDATDEADLLAQTGRTEYVCKTCRDKVSKEQLGKILKDAVATEQVRPPKETLSERLHIRGYSVDQEIKHSGIGVLYKGRVLKTDQPIVIKTLLSQGGVEPYKVYIFQRELDIIRQLHHKHIVQFFEHGKAGHIFYFIFEFVDGMDLAQFIRSKGGRISLEDAVPIMLGVLDGLAYAHHAKITLQDGEGKRETFEGIVHRNLKPQNILLTHKEDLWFPKITDFGLSKSFESAGLTNITTPGDVLGTPIYWPREQITHYRYLDPATDVFSIAAVFYEMLTGSWVREGFKELSKKAKRLGRPPGISDYMNVIGANPPISIRHRNPNIPEPVARVIDQALHETEIPHDKDKMRSILQELRYPDAGAFHDALIGAFKEIDIPESLLNVLDRYRDELLENGTKNEGETEQPLVNAVVYSVIQRTSRTDVALFVLDLVGSTQYILEEGDTNFSTLIRNIFRRVKTHPSSSDLIFLKGTGDGFLSVFHSIPAAFSLAMTFLEAPPHPDLPVRMALHWGSVMISPNKNVSGTEVHKVSQIEGVKIQDQVKPGPDEEIFPAFDRILVTKEVLKRLSDFDKVRFRHAGKFQLKGFKELCELWVLQRELAF